MGEYVGKVDLSLFLTDSGAREHLIRLLTIEMQENIQKAASGKMPDDKAGGAGDAISLLSSCPNDLNPELLLHLIEHHPRGYLTLVQIISITSTVDDAGIIEI